MAIFKTNTLKAKTIDIVKAIIDPASVFKTPDEVLQRNDLTNEQKIKILLSWEYDQREQEVAEEENMQRSASSEPDILDSILHVLNILDPEHKHHHSSPNKQGGEV